MGRDAELAALELGLAAAFARRGGAIAVRGTAGAGKTTICRQVARVAEGAGWSCRWTTADGDARPYAPLVALVEDRFGSLDGRPVVVLGVAYRGDVREDAFSSAFRLRDELLAAGVTWARLKHCAVTAMFHFNISEASAEAHWNRGAQEGKAASRSSRPATRGTTGAASTTRPRASTSERRTITRSSLAR